MEKEILDYLDISAIIEKAQDIVHDGKIDLAQEAVVRIQKIRINDSIFEVSLRVKRTFPV